MDQIIEPSRVICWSARWYGEKKTMFASEYHDGRQAMLQGMWDLLDEADIVVGYNSNSFDIPWIEGEFIVEGFKPPSPFQKVDLMRQAKQHMRLLSRKLDYLSLRLLDDRKVAHTGFSLWRDCLMGDEAAKAKAWATMKKYAIKDTALLPRLYDILLPWIKVPNVAVYAGDAEERCTSCTSQRLERRGLARTATGNYQRYQCQDCGKWSRGSVRISTTPLR
jgi:uncharacterized protein YprB with RNaseH-like and TPR domain